MIIKIKIHVCTQTDTDRQNTNYEGAMYTMHVQQTFGDLSKMTDTHIEVDKQKKKCTPRIHTYIKYIY